MGLVEILALMSAADSAVTLGKQIYNNVQGIVDTSTTLTDEEKAVLVKRLETARDSVSKWE